MRARLITAENRKWWTLGAVSFGLFMIMLDNTVVNVALPAIERDLGAGLSQLEWIVSGYALTFAALMLTGGKLADLLGRRRVFVAGLAVFAGSSLACALAPSAGFLIGARIVQGAGAALMNPATLSIISATFPPRERGAAIGIWAGVSALALAIGPLVGGLLTEHVGWSSIFYLNVPVGIVAIAVSFLLIDESRDTREGQRPDVPGQLASGIGLFAVTYGLIEANGYGWGSGRIVAAFAIGAAALVAFVLLERHQRAPMLDLRLFRNSTFTGANVVLLLVALAMFGVFFFLSLYMQNILGYSPVKAGAAFLPMTGLIIVIAPLAGRLSDRLGSRLLLTGGMTLLAVQLLYFSRLGLHESFWDLVPGMLLGGVGMPAVMAPASAAALSGVPVDRAGVGSAVLNSSRQLGGSIGVALMGAIMAHEIGGRQTPEAFVHGLSVALEVAAAIAVAGALVAAATVRTHVDQGAGPREPATEGGDVGMPIAHAEHAVTIDRPAPVVFDFLADGTNNPRWQTRVLEVQPESNVPGVGVTYAESMRHPFGFRVPTDYKLTEFDRPRRLGFVVTSGGPLRPTGTFELSPSTPAATEVRFTLEYRSARRLLIAPLLPIARLLFRWETRWLDNAKRVLEAQAP